MDKQINHPCIVGIGEILWDILPSGKYMGGAPANFVFHARSLCGEGFSVSAVGQDDLGTEIIETLHKFGLSDQYIAVSDTHPTGTVTVQLDKEGVPDFTIHKNVAWDYIPFTPDLKHLAVETDAVCYGTLAQRSVTSRETIQKFVRATPDECLCVCDVNLRQEHYRADILQETLLLSDVLKLNDDELPIVGKLCGVKENENELLMGFIERFDLKLVALTKGEIGSVLITPDEESVLVAPHVNVVDTVGAGDAFTAALVIGLLQDCPLKAIHRNANNLAAYVCTQKGAMPKLHESLISELTERK